MKVYEIRFVRYTLGEELDGVILKGFEEYEKKNDSEQENFENSVEANLKEREEKYHSSR